MSEQRLGFYFSCNADRSANDYTIYVEQRSEEQVVTLGARYKNSDPSSLYEIDMDADDLKTFGQMCVDLSVRLAQ